MAEEKERRGVILHSTRSDIMHVLYKSPDVNYFGVTCDLDEGHIY
ncbi:hypothetical protein BH10ACI1_BH10ACI1_10300 [soil metagenome]